MSWHLLYSITFHSKISSLVKFIKAAAKCAKNVIAKSRSFHFYKARQSLITKLITSAAHSLQYAQYFITKQDKLTTTCH